MNVDILPRFDRILGFIKDNRPLLKDRPLCHHHGDYHMGH